MRSIIKYIGIALVIVGILLVMKNLFSKESNLSNETEKSYYTARIKLLDQQNKNYIEGAKLTLKDENNKIIAEWTTDSKVKLITKLSKGKYILTQSSTAKNYHLNETKLTFEIKNKDKDVVMYNTKKTEEEIRKENTVSSDVKVDNTASTKNIFTTIIALITTTLGLSLIYKVKNNY